VAKKTAKKASAKKPKRKTAKSITKKKTSRSATSRKTKRAAKSSTRKAKKPPTKRAKKTTKKAAKKKTASKRPGSREAVKNQSSVRTVRIKKTTKPKAPSGKIHDDLEPKPKKLKTRLKKKDLNTYRQLLLAKRATLVGDVTNMTDDALSMNRQSASGDLSNMPIHMADIGSDNFEQEFTLGLIESERQLLREIDEALMRIQDGSYGICLGTGKPIAKARLNAKPWAKYCIEYARRLERGF
jgi:DnaK suppressor protein